MSSASKSKLAIIRAAVLLTFVLASLVISGCSMREPEVCNYNGICAVNETDNCADCKDVLGRDVKDPTGNVIYFNDLDNNNV
jgi:hypothetical protein